MVSSMILQFVKYSEAVRFKVKCQIIGQNYHSLVLSGEIPRTAEMPVPAEKLFHQKTYHINYLISA